MRNARTWMVAVVSAIAIIACGCLIRINVGNVMESLTIIDGFIITLLRVLSPGYALLFAAIPAVIVDYLMGYGHYAVYTFVIQGLVGYTASLLHRKKMNDRLVAVIAALLGFGGYIAVDYLLFGSVQLILSSLVYRVLTTAVSVGLAIICMPVVDDLLDKFLGLH